MFLKLKKIDSYIQIGFLINLILGVISYLFANEGSSARILIWTAVLLTNSFYFSSLSRKNKPIYLVFEIWQWTMMLETIYRLVRYSNTPFEIMYVFDIIAVGYTLSLILRKEIQIDSVVVLSLLLICYGVGITFINGSDLLDCLRAISLIIRFSGLYFYFSKNEFNIPGWVWYFYIFSLIIYVFQVSLGLTVDFRNGLFGYDYTAAVFQLVIIAVFAIYFSKYLTKKNGLWLVIVFFILNELIFLGAEQKTEIILFPLWLMIIILVVKVNIDIGKKIIGIMCAFSALSIAWALSTKVHTKFTSLTNSSVFDAILVRINGTGASKKSALNVLWESEQSTILEKFFGNGMGTSLPPRYLRWVLDTGANDYELFNIVKFSEVFAKHPTYKYFSSNYYNIIFDLGYIGILLLVTILGIFSYRSLFLLRYSKKSSTLALAMVGCWQVIELGFRTINNMVLLSPLAIAISICLFGMISKKVADLKILI